MRRPLRLACAAVGAAILGVPCTQALAQTAPAVAAPAARAPFSAEDLLWMEVRSDEMLLADSINVYASRSGVFVPIGELSRVLDLAVGVFPAQNRAEGWVLERERTLVIDLTEGEARLRDQLFEVLPDQAVIYADDLYLRTDLLEQLLPVRLRPDVRSQVLELTSLEPLPFQQRLERERRRDQLGRESPGEAPVPVVTPYRLFTAPAFDVNLGGLITRHGEDQARRYDIRMAGDMLGAGLEAYLGSDDEGEPSNARIMLSRRDAGGRALGPLGGSEAAIGDVYTPSLALGAASFGGRGVFYTSAPRDSLDIGTPLDLRGELAVGEEVELYVNEVLFAARSTPVQGRYEFLDVPLAYGLNTLRLVFYGAHGETREEVRRVNFGTGQVEAGRWVVRLGAVEQDRTVLGLDSELARGAQGAARMIAGLDYGLSAGLTVSAGLARYSPEADDARLLATLGVRGALGPVATQVDLGFDDTGGRGLALGFAARPGGVSLVGRHSEYRNGFIDETRQPGGAGLAPLRRASDLRADAQVEAFGLIVPLSANLRRLEWTDQRRLTSAELRASAPLGGFYASSSVVYEDERRPDGSGLSRWAGASDVATLVASRLQLRAGLAYDLSPEAELDSGYATADWQLSDRRALRLGVVRTLRGERQTALQASHLWRADRFDLSVNGAWESGTGDWRLGVQLGFGFGYDPGRGAYRMVRPGVASGGSVAVNAWIDENGDGRRQVDEPGVPGVEIDTPAGALTTDEEGRVFTPGLGDPGTALVRLNAEAVEDPFLVGGPTVFPVEPRPGRTISIPYPMRRSAEVELAVLLRGPAGPRPLAAVSLELVPTDGGAILEARSDHAGIAFIEAAPPGTYSVRLQAAQAEALGLTLAGDPVLIVPPAGGFVRAEPVEVRLASNEVER